MNKLSKILFFGCHPQFAVGSVYVTCHLSLKICIKERSMTFETPSQS